MNNEISTAAYINAAQHAGDAAGMGNELIFPVIVIGIIAVVVIIASMLVYDIIFDNDKRENTYNNKL